MCLTRYSFSTEWQLVAHSNSQSLVDDDEATRGSKCLPTTNIKRMERYTFWGVSSFVGVMCDDGYVRLTGGWDACPKCTAIRRLEFRPWN